MATAQQIRHFFEVSMIADALGVPVEFQPRGSYHVTGMTGHGTYDQPVGTWSDDSALTLCLAETLTQGAGPTALMQKFSRYLQGDYTPFGQCFDVGNTTVEAIAAFEQGTPARQAGSRAAVANGNGALMRIAPLAFALTHRPWPTRRRLITAFTTVTHGHPRSQLASWLYVETLRAQLQGRPLWPALHAAWLRVATGASPFEQSQFARLMQPDFGQLPVSAIKASGYVVASLEAAVWCALKAQSVQDVILTAANLGEDTDTVAQIAACLYQASHLDETAPRTWRDSLVTTPQSTRIIADFAAKFGD